MCFIAASLVACPGSAVTLYDASLGNMPGDQGFLYLANELTPAATVSYSGGLTELNTMVDRSESAGFFTHNPFNGSPIHPAAPLLDRTVGYVVSFDLQMLGEGHNARDDNSDGKQDRAGFSVIAIGNDLQGIELGFFHDDVANEIWAYEDNVANPGDLFTQAEGVDRTVAQTAALTTYDLTVAGDGYELSVGGTAILSGLLRDYTAFEGPSFPLVGELDPYEQPNMLFFGDDTSSADSHVRLGNISVTAVPEPSAGLLLLVAGVALFCKVAVSLRKT
ncbi:MAG: hypothetical protein HQ567_24010 [Candidatus Nealsonbacteria bacterium]|nr:hypothetical protein [Candidatus Nealsonbacteria bacterium]